MCLQGKDGTYGTSLRYGVAMDPGCDVMVCFMQNGRLLQPDHGFPVASPPCLGSSIVQELFLLVPWAWCSWQVGVQLLAKAVSPPGSPAISAVPGHVGPV